jgi:hypothetical protein
MLKSSSVSRRNGGGLWFKRLDMTLRSVRPPASREPLPTDILRIVVDVLVREDRASAYSLGLVSKSFRIWVLQTLYETIVFTSPAHVEQIRIVSTLAGSLTMHVRHISLTGLEMHIYGELDRDGGLYKALQHLLSACENLETILYDFKRVPLPFVLPGPSSLTQAHWSHPSRDGWRGHEPAIAHVTHLRVDCAQNDVRNAIIFDTLKTSVPRSFPELTHLSFGVDARLTSGIQMILNFVRGILQRPGMVRVIVMVWHYDPHNAPMSGIIEAFAQIKNPRVCLFVSCGAPDEISSLTDWKDVAEGGRNIWQRAERLKSLHRAHGREVDTGRALVFGSIVYVYGSTGRCFSIDLASD